MTRSNIVYKNILKGLIYKPIGIVLSLIMIPITIKYMGKMEYGIWTTLLSIMVWMDFFDIGIGNGLRNKLTEELALGNIKKSKELIMTSYAVISIISLISFILIGISFFFIKWQSIFNTSKISNVEFAFIMVLNLFFICTNFILKLVNSINYAFQRSAVLGIMQILVQILSLIGILMLSYIGYKNSLLGITIVYGFANVISFLIFTYELFLKNKDYIPKLQDLRWNLIKDISGLGIKFFIIQVSALIIFTTGNMVITQLFGPAEVTPYSIVQRLFGIILMFHGIIIAPIWSATTEAFALKDKKWIVKLIKKLNLIQALIVILSILGIYLIPIIAKLWLHETLNVTFGLLVYSGIYTILLTFCNSYSFILNGIGNLNVQIYTAIIQALLTLPLSIIFAKNMKMGVEGVMLGIVCTLLIPTIVLPIKLKRVLNKL